MAELPEMANLPFCYKKSGIVVRSKFFSLIILVSFCLSFTYSGCSGGGSSDSDGGEGDGNVESGWVTIELPSDSPYATESEVVYLYGETFCFGGSV